MKSEAEGIERPNCGRPGSLLPLKLRAASFIPVPIPYKGNHGFDQEFGQNLFRRRTKVTKAGENRAMPSLSRSALFAEFRLDGRRYFPVSNVRLEAARVNCLRGDR